MAYRYVIDLEAACPQSLALGDTDRAGRKCWGIRHRNCGVLKRPSSEPQRKYSSGPLPAAQRSGHPRHNCTGMSSDRCSEIRAGPWVRTIGVVRRWKRTDREGYCRRLGRYRPGLRHRRIRQRSTFAKLGAAPARFKATRPACAPRPGPHRSRKRDLACLIVLDTELRQQVFRRDRHLPRTSAY